MRPGCVGEGLGVPVAVGMGVVRVLLEEVEVSLRVVV